MFRTGLAALLLLHATAVCGEPARKETAARHATPLAISAQPVTVTLDVTRSKSRLAAAAKSAASTVVLEIEGAAADKPPGFIVAVFIGEERVGEVSLYAVDQPQSFVFAADAAVAKALRGRTSIEVRFVPESGLEGQPARPEAPVRIAAVSLAIERP